MPRAALPISSSSSGGDRLLRDIGPHQAFRFGGWNGRRAADEVTTSRLAEPEARAALAAAARGRRVTPIGHAAAKRELAWRLDRTLIVEVSADVASHAGDLAERHGLRGYDAVHLASALAAGPVAAVVTWDAALGEAALKEGLAVIPAPAASA